MVATNKFQQTDKAINAPYTRAVSVTPSDTTDLNEIPRGLHADGVGSHHNVAVILEGDASSVIINMAKGHIMPLRVRRVLATGTTATSVVALY